VQDQARWLRQRLDAGIRAIDERAAGIAAKLSGNKTDGGRRFSSISSLVAIHAGMAERI
jgi:hypothetical protein